MSCTEIYVISPGGDVLPYAEVRNASACAMHIWMEISKKHGVEFPWDSKSKALWRLFYDPSPLEMYERIALGLGYDRVWIRRENLTKVADALDEFWKHHGAGTDVIPAIPEVARVLRRAADEDVRGVCFNPTSTNSNPWSVKIPYAEAVASGCARSAEDYVEDPDRRPFNFDREGDRVNGGRPYEMFEHMRTDGGYGS